MSLEIKPKIPVHSQERVVRLQAFPPREILIVHGERPIDDIVRKFETRKDKYQIRKCLSISEGMEAFR